MDRSEMKVIGGSTISAVLGLNRWLSPHSLYLRLTEQLAPQEENEAMERGKALEPIVAAMFAANHPEFAVETHGIVTHENYPFIIGSPDRVLIQGGELDSVLEIKTADISKMSEYGEEFTDEFPVEYLCQCMLYAGLLECDDCHLAVGFVKPGSRKIVGYKEYLVKTDWKQYITMLHKAEEFWNNHVIPLVPPQITEADSETVRYYRTKYPQHEADKWAENDEEVDRLAELLLDCKKDLDGYEREYELLKTRFIAALKEKEGAKTPLGNFTYRTSKPVKRTDWEGIVKHINVSPETIDRFTTETPGSRRFLIPKQKGGA